MNAHAPPSPLKIVLEFLEFLDYVFKVIRV
jgi:hypothetical protein